MNDRNLNALIDYLNNYKFITFLTGAGISTESKIDDFASTDKQWTYKIPRVQAISKGYYEQNPKEFWKIFKETFKMKLMKNYRPNYGHIFLKELEDKGKVVNILTQNVDGLHQIAGSTNVYELHGTIQTATCPKCKKQYDLTHIMKEEVPRCDCNPNIKYILKPDVVLFGDIPKHLKKAEEILNQTEVFIVLGSSLEVYPVNNLPLYAKLGGQTHLCIINKDETIMDFEFHTVIHGNISTVFEKIKKHII